MTRVERAKQVAMRVGEEFGWDRKGVNLLATIFNRYGWSAAKEAIWGEINAGMTPQELTLAEEVRQIWKQRTEFGSTLNKFGEIVQRYSLISWPTSLTLIRSFKGYPQAEEVESLLDNCFERWQDSDILQRRFPGFYSFALYRVGAYGDLPEQDGWTVFDQYSTDEGGFDNVVHVAQQLKHYGIHIDPQEKCIEPRYWDERWVPNIQTCIPVPEGINSLPDAWDENLQGNEEESC